MASPSVTPAEADFAAAVPRAPPTLAQLEALAGSAPMVEVDDLVAGYGYMEILHGFSLRAGRGRSLCLIGPNGAGKSTVLHAIYGLARVMAGTIRVNGHDITSLPPQQKLEAARMAYVLQDSSIFPDMTVLENLLMGGYRMPLRHQAAAAADRICTRYPALGHRRSQRANVLSGGERRLLEIARALMMEPEVLLVDEPSIGLSPRNIDMVFEILSELRDAAGKTIILVEQNARRGLEFADVGYVLVAGQLVMAGSGEALRQDPDVGRRFLGI